MCAMLFLYLVKVLIISIIQSPVPLFTSFAHSYLLSLTVSCLFFFFFSLFLQFFIVLSCLIAVGTNLSQFICIGRFSAVSFQVLGHMKTILVLILGFIFFGKEGLNLHVILGMILAVTGMIWYGNASSKPGGKERRSYLMSIDKSQRHGVLSEQGEHDEKV